MSTLAVLFCLGFGLQRPESEVQRQLYIAISRNSIKQFNDAIRNGADVLSRTGKNCLVLAAEHDADRIVDTIAGWVRPGSDGQEWHRRELGWAAEIACDHGNARILKLLLKAGLDPKPRDQIFPLIESTAFANHPDCFLALLEAGGDPTACDSRVGMNTIDAAVFARSPQILNGLSSHNIKLDVLDRLGRSPLFYVARIRNGPDRRARFALLLRLGVNPSVVDSSGQTAINALMDDEHLVSILCRLGANINRLDASGMAPIHHASEIGDEQGWLSLARCGANVEIKTSDGKSCAEIARSKGFQHLAATIEQYNRRM